MSSRKLISLFAAQLIVLSLVTWASDAFAQMRVRPPSTSQIKAASTMFKRGLVVTIEPDNSGGLSQVTVFGRINAPVKTVYEVLTDPSALPDMQPAMRDIKVRAKRGNALTYSWTYGDVLTRIEGVWSLALAPEKAVSLRSMSGFGPGFALYRLYPEGDQTTVTLSMNIDVTQSNNAILRWLTNASPDFRQAWNLGYAAICYRGLERVAVKRAGNGPLPPATGKAGAGPLRPLAPNQAKSLGPLLKRGTVAILQTDKQGRISQASLAERVNAPPPAVAKVIKNPGAWSRFIKSLEIDDVEEVEGGQKASLGFSFVAFTLETDIELSHNDGATDLVSPSGQLHRSLISWRYAADGSGTILTTTGRIRYRQGGRMLRGMIDADPDFGHALNASTLVVFSRGMKLRAEGNR